MLKRHFGTVMKGLLICSLAAVIFAPNIVAQTVIKGPKLPFWFWGVNSDGNLTPTLGGLGFGKFFKYDTDSLGEFIVGKGRAKVTNESGAKASFTNLGLPIIDPETGDEYVTTADSYDVRKKAGIRAAKVKAAGVYYPD